MNYKIKNGSVHAINNLFKELEDLLTDRISDCHEIKGMMQCRHAYIFYRKLLQEIKMKFNNDLIAGKQSKEK